MEETDLYVQKYVADAETYEIQECFEYIEKADGTRKLIRESKLSYDGEKYEVSEELKAQLDSGDTRTVTPVSYTHLDVYKRQDLGRMDEAEGYLLEAAGKDLDYSDHCVHYPAYADFVPWTMLCRLYLERGEFPRAYNCHLKAKKSRPGNPQVFFYDLYFREADGQLLKK